MNNLEYSINNVNNIENNLEFIENITRNNLDNFKELLNEFSIYSLRELLIKIKFSKNFFQKFSLFFIDLIKKYFFYQYLHNPINISSYIFINIGFTIKEIINNIIESYYKQETYFYEIYFKFLEIRNYLKENKINFIISNSISRFTLNINEITFIIHYLFSDFNKFIKNFALNLNLKIYKLEKYKIIDDDYLIKIYFYNIKVPVIFIFSKDIFNILIYDLYFTYKDTINEIDFFENTIKIYNYNSLKDFIIYFSKLDKYNNLKKEISLCKNINEIYNLFYSYFNLNYIPSELSDYPQIIKIAKNNDFNDLVKLEDIKGDLHIHTNLSDGLNSINEIINFVKTNKTNYNYIGITDHVNYLNLNQLKDLKEYIKNNINSDKFKVLLGIEENIDENGLLYSQKLDNYLEVLNNIDFINASIHSHFNLKEDQQYNRLSKIAENNNPKILTISHLTTRVLNIRNPISLSTDKIIEIINKLNKNNKYIEINCHLDRLDVDYNILREYYLKYKIKPNVVISTDAHNINHLDYIEFGVKIARKSLISKKNVLNTKENIL
ncbi:MAG: PHP domain-containing protein [bacterium]